MRLIFITFRILIFLLLLMFLVSCTKNENSISGYYFDIKDRKIYEFKSSELLIYDISDSTKTTCKLNIEKNRLNIKNKQGNFRLYFTIEQDSLWLIDNEQLFLKKNEIKLIKYKFSNSLKAKLLFKNYWYGKSFDKESEFWYKFKQEGLSYNSDLYRKDKNKEVYYNSSFDFQEYLYFNKFLIYRIQSHAFFLIDITSDSLKLREVYNFNKVNFSNYISKIDSRIYGTWVNVNSNKRPLTLYDRAKENKFYFGDTIMFTNNKFIRKINSFENYYYQDSLMLGDKKRINDLNKHSKELPIFFELGLDTKFLLFKKPINKVLKIKKLSKDSLVLINDFLGDPRLMKYIRVSPVVP